MSAEERFDLERQYHDQEGHVARLAGRLKSACCRQCGGVDGMQAVHRETMDSMPAEALRLLDVLYYRAGTGAYLFYACNRCNQDKVIPDGLSALGLDDILCWINIGRPRPDYAALAAEPEPVLTSLRDRESAGI